MYVSKFFRRYAWLALTIAGLGLLLAPTHAQQGDKSFNWLKQTIEHQLAKRGILKDNNIEVTVTDGTITLDGTVSSVGDKRRAHVIAGRAMSDFVIQDDLMVAGALVTNGELADRVQATIDNSAFYSMYDWVRADVKKGVVTLNGYVLDSRQAFDIVDVAGCVPGVQEVIDKTDVLPTSARDDEIRHAAARAVYLDYYGGSPTPEWVRPVHIVVADGNVALDGWVKSEVERTEIENLVDYYTRNGHITDNLVLRP